MSKDQTTSTTVNCNCSILTPPASTLLLTLIGTIFVTVIIILAIEYNHQRYKKRLYKQFSTLYGPYGQQDINTGCC